MASWIMPLVFVPKKQRRQPGLLPLSLLLEGLLVLQAHGTGLQLTVPPPEEADGLPTQR